MNSQTENFKQVEKSTAECEAFNTANKSLIDLGIELPLRPTAAILQKEEEDKKKAALAIGEEKRFDACCEKFWNEVKKLLSEPAQKDAKIKGKVFSFSNHAEGMEVAIHTTYENYGRFSRSPKGQTLRVQTSGLGRKKIFKSKTQNIESLHAEKETVQKSAELLAANHQSKVVQQERENESARRYAGGKAAYDANREIFDSLGIYSLTGENSIFQAKLTIEATIEQWKAIANILKERNQPK